MKRTLLGAFLVLLASFTSITAFAQVEQVTELTVTNPRAMVATLDQYLESGGMKAHSVTLLAHIHDGVSPSTHTVVAIYDDLDALEAAMEARPTSTAWATTAVLVAGTCFA